MKLFLVLTMTFLTNLAISQNSFPPSGNVGIGTNSPKRSLHVIKGASGLNNGYGLTSGIDIESNNISGINIISPNTGFGRIYFGSPSSKTAGALEYIHSSSLPSGYMKLRVGGVDRMFLLGNGNVGIGTNTPKRKLHIKNGDSGLDNAFGLTNGIDIESNNISGINLISPNSGFGRIYFGSPSSKTAGALEYIHSSSLASGYMKLRAGGVDRMFLLGNGNVGIGLSSPQHKLDVNGDIHAKEIIVDLNFPGPDYVFEEDYDLPSLKSTQAYIRENKHLPEVPSAKEMEEKGIDVGVMNMLLLKKVEELTLHLIEQNTKLEAQGKEIERLKVLLGDN